MTTPINVVGEGLVGVDHRVNALVEPAVVCDVLKNDRYRCLVKSQRQGVAEEFTYEVIAIGWLWCPVIVFKNDETVIEEIPMAGREWPGPGTQVMASETNGDGSWSVNGFPPNTTGDPNNPPRPVFNYTNDWPVSGMRPLRTNDSVLLLGTGGSYFIIAVRPELRYPTWQQGRRPADDSFKCPVVV